MKKEKDQKFDVHKLITNFFNVKLNPFIAKYGRIEKDGDITLTGGLMQINRKKVHKFKQYCDWLE